MEDELIKSLTPDLLPPHKNTNEVKEWCKVLIDASKVEPLPIKKFTELPPRPLDTSSLDEFNRLLNLNKRELKKELKIAKRENNQQKIGYLQYLILK